MTQETLMRGVRCVGAVALAIGTAACTMKSQEAPDLAGPSEFAQSITVSASPDVLSQDGASQSVISVVARGPNGEPLRNVSMRAEVQVDGTTADFGSMSARNILTNAEGRASLVYTAPVGTDFANSTNRRVAIRLVPPGAVLPPDGLRPSFTTSPEAPLDNQAVFFDASASQPSSGIASYAWNFGDGSHGSGRTTTHSYDTTGTYHATLTISDQFGRSASATVTVVVGAGAGPTAAFVFSPAAPRINQNIAFNASGSRAAAGRQIVSYTWDFGDGRPLVTQSGPTVNYSYAVAGNYRVTLVVTDDTGKTGSIPVDVVVTPAS
jgi:PKD repeat protein